MIFIAGRGLYGRVDDVPGLFYVKTSFVHVYYVPLIPVGSYLIFEGTETDNGFQGVKIGFSLKSILATWLRAALVIGVIFFVFVATALLCNDQEPKPLEAAKMALWAAAFFGAFLVTQRYSHAGPYRALRLARAAGIPEEVVQGHLSMTGTALDPQP
jgi:hypothetical protein